MEYKYIGLYVNGILVWKCKDWKEYNEVAEEQKEYHKGESVKITYKLYMGNVQLFGFTNIGKSLAERPEYKNFINNLK